MFVGDKNKMNNDENDEEYVTEETIKEWKTTLLLYLAITVLLILLFCVLASFAGVGFFTAFAGYVAAIIIIQLNLAVARWLRVKKVLDDMKEYIRETEDQ